MSLPKDQLVIIKSVWPDAQLVEEGGKPFVLLASVRLPDRCTPKIVACLICPHERDGYPCRLFLSERVTGGKPVNWNTSTAIAERSWQAFSLKLSNPTPTLYDIAHHFLGALA
ncbi:MAG: hypothetical protein Q8L55_07305 [Phycisphaerales bacterium]|nr:hypothetical protein [Phycisphaerales bacterium]